MDCKSRTELRDTTRCWLRNASKKSINQMTRKWKNLKRKRYDCTCLRCRSTYTPSRTHCVFCRSRCWSLRMTCSEGVEVSYQENLQADSQRCFSQKCFSQKCLSQKCLSQKLNKKRNRKKRRRSNQLKHKTIWQWCLAFKLLREIFTPQTLEMTIIWKKSILTSMRTTNAKEYSKALSIFTLGDRMGM